MQDRKTGQLGTVTGASGYGINVQMDGPDNVTRNYRMQVHFERDLALVTPRTDKLSESR